MPVAHANSLGSLGIEQQTRLFLLSAFMFRMGLFFETFEDVRPAEVMMSDYFFLASLVLLLCSSQRRLLNSRGSGVLAAGALILCGAAFSFVSVSSAGTAAGPLLRVFMLFGLFAPLAVVHSRNIRANVLFLLAGVSANCLAAMFAAWVSPDLIDGLAINPQVDTDLGQSIGRFAGLAGHSNILGLSAALGVLAAIGLLLSEKRTLVRLVLLFHVLVCAVGGFLTGSRTFFVSLVPALLVLTLWRRLNRRVIMRFCGAVLCLLAVGAGINYFAPDLLADYTDRVTATSADFNENYGRVLTAGLALVEIAQKPISGWGVDHFGEAGLMYLPEDNDFMPAHISFLHYWYAAGVVAAAGFLMLFFLPVRGMLKALKVNPSGTLASALRLGVSVYLLLFIASNLHPILFNRFLYMPLFVFAGLAARMPESNYVRKLAPQKMMRLSGPNIEATL